MFNRNKIIAFFFLLFLFFPAQTYAYQQASLGASDSIVCEFYFSIINFSIALVITGLIAQMFNRLIGRLRTAWFYFLGSSICLTLLQFFALLAVFDIFSFPPLICGFQFIMFILLLLGVLAFKGIFESIVKNKSFSAGNNK